MNQENYTCLKTKTFEDPRCDGANKTQADERENQVPLREREKT
jgi:hypothetical protein